MYSSEFVVNIEWIYINVYCDVVQHTVRILYNASWYGKLLSKLCHVDMFPVVLHS